MEQIEMKFPGLSADPLHSHSYSYPLAQKRIWKRTCWIFLLVLLILHFFIITIVLLNKHSNDQKSKTESAQDQNQNKEEDLNGHSNFYNTSVIDAEFKRVHDKIALLSAQNGTVSHYFHSPPSFSASSSTPVPTPVSVSTPVPANKNSPRGSILQLISSSKPDSRKALVDVIGRAKAHILVRVQEHGDDYIEFDYNQNGTMNPPCQNLPLAFQRHSTSAVLDTLGTCIRLYSLDDCVGDSMAYYPTVVEESESFSFQSLGRCLANELDESVLKTETEENGESGRKEMTFQKSLFTNNSSLFVVPDLLYIDSFMARDSNSHFKSPGRSPITDFILDGESRIKLLRVVVQKKDLKWNVDNSILLHYYEQRSYDTKKDELKMNMKNGDNICYFISRRFSPPDNEIYKMMFYQSRWNFRHLGEVEDTIFNWLQKNPTSSVEIRVQVYYKEKNTRPDGFLYWVKYNYADKQGSNVQVCYLRNP